MFGIADPAGLIVSQEPWYNPVNHQLDMRNITTMGTKDPAIPVLQSNLFYCRNRCRLTQQQLADRSGISRYMIHRIETEKSGPSVFVALRLAKALGLQVDELFEIRYVLPKPLAHRPKHRMRLALRRMPKS
jgi:DNA-binding XRE family transcriptional regulator